MKKSKRFAKQLKSYKKMDSGLSFSPEVPPVSFDLKVQPRDDQQKPTFSFINLNGARLLRLFRISGSAAEHFYITEEGQLFSLTEGNYEMNLYLEVRDIPNSKGEQITYEIHHYSIEPSMKKEKAHGKRKNKR